MPGASLARTVVHLATAPKSNAAYLGIDAAIADVRAGDFGRVPKHLRDAHYPGAKRLGHGKGYLYPHDAAVGVVPHSTCQTSCAVGSTTSPASTATSARCLPASPRSAASSVGSLSCAHRALAKQPRVRLSEA